MTVNEINEIFAILHIDVDLSTADEIKEAFRIICTADKMNSAERDTLRAAYWDGPLFDGDVPSKTGRDALLDMGFIVKVVVGGEEGFNACTYAGASAYRIWEATAGQNAQICG